ncbi:hypothetical protein KAU15_07325 [candidate division WOR-3 bacterium]|nr:hypothetical protein [candidate division WOR-3 bacterium]
MKKNTIIIICIVITMIVTNCTILPWVKDINNIRDWVTIPGDGNEYRYETRTKYYSEDSWHDLSDFTIEITDIDEKSDAILIETKYNDSNNRDYIIIDKDENLIAYSEDEYTDEDNDFIILKTPIEVGNKWYNDDYDFEIDKIGESMEVEAGTYNDCIVIIYTSNNANGEIWYSPSVGTYIYDDYELDSGYHSIVELKQIRTD